MYVYVNGNRKADVAPGENYSDTADLVVSKSQ